jgi:proteic killer suppression protein
MIRNFKHKGLERFFLQGSSAGISANHARRLRLVLGRLNVATEPCDMDLPGLHLHRLSGSDKARWSVRVSGNWRVTFEFDSPDVCRVDYEDYY